MSRAMTTILYPVAETAEAALWAARGLAARAREAQALAAAPVVFATEAVGPAFTTREGALDAYLDRLRSAAHAGVSPAEAALDEDARGWLRLTPVAAPKRDGAAAKAVQPIYAEGRRWPAPAADVAVLWRLSVSFWRIRTAAERAPPLDAARRMRRDEAGRELAAAALGALARQPLRALRPQQPLDIGLFETRPPEAPDTLIPDE